MPTDMFGVGFSHAKNPLTAARAAAGAALGQLEGRELNGCLVFATVGYDQEELLGELGRQLGGVPMAGCSGAGVIAPGLADESSHGLVVLAMADPRLRLATAAVADLADPAAAGRALGAALGRSLRADSRCVLLFPCGLKAAMDDLMPGLEDGLGAPLPVLGGLAADNNLRERTYQYHDWRVLQGGASAALLSGAFELLAGVGHGCVPLGLEMAVTAVEGNRLREIDHRPAADILREYAGREAGDFGRLTTHFCIAQPAAPGPDGSQDPCLIHYLTQYHAEDQSFTTPVRFHPGDRIWVARQDWDTALAASERCAGGLLERLRGRRPGLVLDINCVSRGRAGLPEGARREWLERLQAQLGQGCPWLGFYSYGELCPAGGRNLFHHFSEVLALLVWR